MPPEKTAVLTLWPAHDASQAAPRGGQYRLMEGFRPVWHGLPRPANGGHPLTTSPDGALVTVLAGHLAAAGQSRAGVTLPARCRQGVALSPGQRAAALAAFAGRSVSLLRYDYCCLSDRQLDEARAAGVDLDLVDLPLPPVAEPTWTVQSSAAPSPNSYPGWRPDGSWRLMPSGKLHGLSRRQRAWIDRASGEPFDMTGRSLVLGYGSNLDPSKLAERFPGQEIAMLTVEVIGWAAAWCDARRSDGTVVATLVPLREHRETHGVLGVTAEQLREIDGWEGHPRFYRRQPFGGLLLHEDGAALRNVEVYLGTAEMRPPLLRRGQPFLLADTPYDVVDDLVAARGAW